MKLDSKFFDHLRVKPDENRLLRDTRARNAIGKAATSPAFTRRRRAVAWRGSITATASTTSAQYNKSYNYFSGYAR